MLRSGVAVSALLIALGGPAMAQSTSDAQIKALQQQIDALQKAVNQLREQQAASAAATRAAEVRATQAQARADKAMQAHAASPAPAVAAAPVAVAAITAAPAEDRDANGHTFLQRKKGDPVTFYTPGGEITTYGNIDVSVDGTTKNLGPAPTRASDGTKPVGNFGWMPALSTNLSYVGVRGFQNISGESFRFVYQLEAGFDVTATPGTKETNSNQSNAVNGALFSRNSYIGLSSDEWGALKLGKTDAPYKTSTARFNPFSGMLGDYQVIMGNTGGDNRVEFGTRMDHSIWYESPTFLGGFNANVLFSPGQNRSTISDNIAAGGSDCAGGNVPGSGGTVAPGAATAGCTDGSFSDAVSANLSYTNGPLYVTIAYEFHSRVNRQSDQYGNVPQALIDQDVADEDAAKIGALYTLPTKTTFGGIFESMHRYVPSDLSFQNERQRLGTWFFVSQQLTDADSVHFGWAHAFRTPGDPGQHNTATQTTAAGYAYGSNHNQADMLTIAYKHQFGPSLTWYIDAAATVNGSSAHYDLGAGGRGVTTDCHDANGAAGGSVLSSPQCWAGQTLVGVSTGLRWIW